MKAYKVDYGYGHTHLFCEVEDGYLCVDCHLPEIYGTNYDTKCGAPTFFSELSPMGDEKTVKLHGDIAKSAKIKVEYYNQQWIEDEKTKVWEKEIMEERERENH